MTRDRKRYTHPDPITVGRLRQELAGYPDDFDLTFSGLDFYRVKQRGDRVVDVEFAQSVYRDDLGKVQITNFDDA